MERNILKQFSLLMDILDDSDKDKLKEAFPDYYRALNDSSAEVMLSFKKIRLSVRLYSVLKHVARYGEYGNLGVDNYVNHILKVHLHKKSKMYFVEDENK